MTIMGSAPQRVVVVVAVGMSVVGLILALATDAAYSASSFRWTFDLMPRRVWGVLFLASGLVTAFSGDRTPGRLAGAALTLLLTVYGSTLLFAIWSGDSASGSNWVWSWTLAAVLALCRPHRVTTE